MAILRVSSRKNQLKLCLYHIVMIVICVIYLFPFFYIVSNALKPSYLIITYPPKWIFQPTLKNFVTVMKEYQYFKNLANSLIVGLSSTGLGLAIAATSAYAITRYHQKKIALLVLLSMMMPYIVCLIPLFIFFQKIGWLDTYQGLIVTHLIITAPQTVWILMGFMEGIPMEFEEAALLDGCGKIRVFFHIILPLISPGLVAAGILSFSFSWNDFKLALVVSGGKTTTAPLMLFSFVGKHAISWGSLLAAITIMIIPTVIFALLVQKHLAHGLTMGGIR